MPYEEIDLNTANPDHIGLLIDFLDKHDLNDGDSPVYLYYDEDRDTFTVSWPEPVPLHLRCQVDHD